MLDDITIVSLTITTCTVVEFSSPVSVLLIEISVVLLPILSGPYISLTFTC